MTPANDNRRNSDGFDTLLFAVVAGTLAVLAVAAFLNCLRFLPLEGVAL